MEGVRHIPAGGGAAARPPQKGKSRLSPKQRRGLARIAAGLALLLAGALAPLPAPAGAALLLASYAAAGWDVLWRAVRNIFRGQVFDENFLMAAATVGAVCLGEYTEGVAVMLFYQVGEWFQRYAVGRSRASIAALMGIRPDYANLRGAGGALRRVQPQEVAVGGVIVVKPGERVPLDGVVTEGASSLDTSALTGESLPRDVAAGDEVASGCINLSGVLAVRATRVYGESTVARILELVENAGAKKAKTEQFITRFARYYTPAVCLAALALALAPPLLAGGAFGLWVYRALTFLVISCPCALVVSIPLGFFGGIGGASRQGILVKGGNYLEALAKAETVVFDKTGTLTEGRFTVREVCPVGRSREEVLALAGAAERYSSHPIAKSIAAAAPGTAPRVTDAGEEAGFGVHATVNGVRVLAGSAGLLAAHGISVAGRPPAGTVVHVAADGAYAGWILMEDAVKADAKEAVARLRGLGITKTVLLTGDADAAGRRVGTALGFDEVKTRLLPQDKVAQVEALLNAPRRKGTVVFVGDGVNDAPVLARADVGVAMGGLGSDAAIEAADVVIMTDEPLRLVAAIRVGRKTMAIARQNIVFALGVKGVVLALGALGFTSMWAAVFADVGVSVLAVLNAMRALGAGGGEAA